MERRQIEKEPAMSEPVTRREWMNLAASGAVAAAWPAAAGAQTTPTELRPASAFRGQHQPKALAFEPSKLRGLSERLVRSHWENNYGGAVRALNAVEQRLDAMMKDKELPPYVYGDLKREELVRTGSVVLHERYFDNLGGDGRASGKALDWLKQWFGSYEAWEAEFKRTANALGGGSGWAILALNLHTGEVHNYWAWDHAHNAAAGFPLLVLDMYEHSYHMDYGAAAARYVDAFMQNVQWEEVNRRCERAEAALKALRG
jgi:Fe-Mn family superoxide dismutase